MTRLLYFGILLLTLTLCFLSCKGQIKENALNKGADVTKISQAEHPKLIKTQGSTTGDNVNSSLQDQAGNLWFGTTGEGIYKFDGTTFQQYTVADGLKSNTVFYIFEAPDGKIWIGTDNGLSIYDGKTFSELPITAPVYSLKNKLFIFHILQDRKGRIWVATVEGVYIYEEGRFTEFVVNAEAGGYISDKNNVEKILEDKDGNIWLGGRVNVGVYRYDGQNITNFKLKELAGHDWAWPAAQDSNGDIWLSNWGGVYRYDGTSFVAFTKEDGLCGAPITRIMQDKKGKLLFGGGNGICTYEPALQSFSPIFTQEPLKQNGVWSILEDRNGYLWIGTRNTGLFRYDGESLTAFSEE